MPRTKRRRRPRAIPGSRPTRDRYCSAKGVSPRPLGEEMQHADPEIEAVQDDIASQDRTDEEEPDDMQVHGIIPGREAAPESPAAARGAARAGLALPGIRARAGSGR